jgi:hypothetical protein
MVLRHLHCSSALPLNGSALVGEHPSLTDLERGNLKFTTDFRDLYGTVMNKWLCIDQQMVEEYLLGRPLQLVDLGFDCNGITNPPDDDPPLVVIEGFDHKPVYAEGEDVAVYIEIPEAGLLDIQLYNILGQRIGTIKNENDDRRLVYHSYQTKYGYPSFYRAVYLQNNIQRQKIQ